jgi:DNA-binding IclR family transcriptional regulator
MAKDADIREKVGPKVGSITHALAVLRYLSTARTPEGVTSIARALGISPSSCFNILKTLTAERYVDFDNRTKGYTLGWAPVVLARRALDPEGALDLLMPEMEAMASRYRVACSLGRVAGERTMLIGFSESEAATRIHLRVGHRVPLLAGASGRCIAALRNFSSAEIEKGFNSIQWENPLTFAEYMAQVEFARNHGWAIDANYAFRGVTTIATAVLNSAGEAKYMLHCTMFSGQYPHETLTSIGADLLGLAKRASGLLFGPGELPLPGQRARPAGARGASAIKPAPEPRRRKARAAG